MTTDYKAFRDQLVQLRAGLQSLGESLDESGKTVELDQTLMGRLSRIDAMQGQQMALEASRRRVIKLAGIDRALKRIDAGEYGYCLECDEEIDPRRLVADPTNDHCIKCAE